jgi:tripartite-type tricarboxylate transporter receptor subunit TctC
MLKQLSAGKTVAVIILILLTVTFTAGVSMAKYPARRITLIHPWKPGMPAHVAAQLLADKMGKILGKKIVVNCVTGGSGVKAVTQTLSKPADGYTIMNMYGAPGATVPLTREVKYDPVKDFIPIGGPLQAVDVITIRKKETRFRTFKEMIEYGKKNPGLKYGTARNTLPHLSIVILLRRENVKCKIVPYPGSVLAMKDLLAGVIDFAIPNAGGYVTYKEDIIPLATMTARSTKLVPNTPPVPEVYDSPVASGWNFWTLKKGTPKDRAKILEDAMAQVFKDPSYEKKLNEIGWELAGRPPEDYEKVIETTQSVLKEGVEASKWEAELKF